MLRNLKKQSLIILLLMILVFASLVPTSYALSNSNFKGGVLIEANSGRVLYQYNKDKSLPQASITKVMTYLVFREFVEDKKLSTSTKVRINISETPASLEGGGIGLKKGNTITIRELYETLLIKSANDSALVIGDYYKSQTKKDIVSEMNKKAKSLGLSNTSFINPHGLTDKRNPKKLRYNKTTPYETAKLVDYIIKKYPDSIGITSKKTCNYGGKTYKSTNILLTQRPGVDGFKTGYTTVAGYCMVSTEDLTLTNGNGQAFRLVAVVLGTQSSSVRAKECGELLEYGKQNFMNNRFGGVAESKILYELRAKLEGLNSLLTVENLDMKNYNKWEKCLGEANGLIKNLPTIDRSEGEKLKVVINKSGDLIELISKINQLETSINNNSHTAQNLPQWEKYLGEIRLLHSKLDVDMFKNQHAYLLDRVNRCELIIEKIKEV
ncbi:MAG: D-alanyl-D-alanine carboxypeptidase family protein [Clostridium sp.]